MSFYDFHIRQEVFPVRDYMQYLFSISIMSISVCPLGWSRFQMSCYRLFSETKLDWTTAKFHCRDRQSHLVSLHSVEEWEFVTKMLINVTLFPDDLWTGGYKSDTWKWDDNSPLSEDGWVNTMWAYGNPDGTPYDCMYMWKEDGYRLADTDCEAHPKPFVCKINTGKLVFHSKS